ncbi:glycoside hydrolase family 18 protein [Hydnomerulius pinastri MD-312]|nr:glycoside hydrolase family 18 protein [Hydnomerulius pinastri MD-312]
MTYIADWAPPTSIDYSKFDMVIFAFALPDENGDLAWDTDTAPSMLQQVVPAAHAQSKKVSLSVGGWTGSKYFSTAVSNPQARQKFANNILAAYQKWDLDGIDIDWEYPGQSGQAGNEESSNDTANMLEFFKVLRATLPANAKISAAVQDTPFAGPDGKPVKDAAGFAQLIDFVTLMNYDTYESENPAGPNAPLYDGCGNSNQPSQTAVGGHNAWTAAGFPASQIVLGVPAYGYIVESTDRRLRSRGQRATPEDGSGQIQFNSLLSQGILERNNNDGSFSATGGRFTRQWDSCSATPYLYSDDQVIPYDDPESLSMKAAWVKDMKMGGVNLFDAHGDTAQHDLIDALRSGLFGVPSSAAAAPPPPTSSYGTAVPSALAPSPV